MFLSIRHSLFLLLYLFPLTVIAEGLQGPTASIDNPIGAGSIQDFISDILGILVQVGAPIVVLFIVYTGFLFVTAQGNPTKLEKAKSAFFWVLIGAIILLAAQAIADAISGTVDQLK